MEKPSRLAAGFVASAPQLIAPVSGVDAIIIGHRVPRDYFVTTGFGESDVTVHAGSYHLALRAAGIEMCNIITYSSILPSCAREVSRPSDLTHGAVMETIMANGTARRGRRATAGIIMGRLYRRDSGEKHGGFVCECSGSMTRERAERQLRESIRELYENGYAEEFELRDLQVIIESFVPKKRYGSAIVALCFMNHLIPIYEAECPDRAATGIEMLPEKQSKPLSPELIPASGESVASPAAREVFTEQAAVKPAV